MLARAFFLPTSLGVLPPIAPMGRYGWAKQPELQTFFMVHDYAAGLHYFDWGSALLFCVKSSWDVFGF